MIQRAFICAKIVSFQSEKILLGREEIYRKDIEKRTDVSWMSSSVHRGSHIFLINLMIDYVVLVEKVDSIIYSSSNRVKK